MAKKTLKFKVEENHTGFEKVNVNPTRAFNTDEDIIEDSEGFSLLSNEELQERLDSDALTDPQIAKVKAILKSRQ